MNIEAFAGINDVEKIKGIALSFAKDFSNRERNYKAEIRILKEQIKNLQNKLFGRKT